MEQQCPARDDGQRTYVRISRRRFKAHRLPVGALDILKVVSARLVILR
jgi:hypothetical protein